MSEQNNIDELFRRRMKDFEAQPSEEVWENVADHIDSSAPSQRKFNWKPWAVAASLFLAVISGFALGVYYSNTFTSENSSSKTLVSNKAGQLTDSKLLSQHIITQERQEEEQEVDRSSSSPSHTSSHNKGRTPLKTRDDKTVTKDEEQMRANTNEQTSSVETEEKTEESHLSTTSQSNSQSTVTVTSEESHSSTKNKESSVGDKTSQIEEENIQSIPTLEAKSIPLKNITIAMNRALNDHHESLLASSESREEVEELFDEQRSLMPRGFYAGVLGKAHHSWILNEDRFDQGSSGDMTTAFNLGSRVGVKLGYSISDKFAVQAEWALNNQGHKYEGVFTREVKVNYSEVAVLTKFRASKLTGARALPMANSILVGPYYSILRSAEVVDIGDPSTAVNRFKNYDYGFIAGLEHERYLTDKVSLTLGVRGKLGIHHIGNEINYSSETQYYNASVGLQVGLKFIQPKRGSLLGLK